ncbi:MAG TPA: ABC transporter permease [Vicinamibacterales bacterium]|nr:ABC transporter permease [Vicinamibacterales bacterium]
MRWIDRFRYYCRAVLRRGRIDRELDEELGSWVDELARRHQGRGHDEPTAQRLALADLGGVDRLRDEVRSTRPGHTVEGVMQDVRYAWRSLSRSPGFLTAVVLTFALGIGANTAIFSVVNAMLIAPLPYRDAGRLVFVWTDNTSTGYPRVPLSAAELVDLRTRTTHFEGFGAIWANTTTLTDGEPEQLRIGLVTSDFFSVLGAPAAIGRTFDATDETGPPGMLISWALFERRFGGDPSVVGRRIQSNGQPITVIGVMPKDFRLLLPTDSSVPDDLQAWQMLRAANFARAPRGQQFLRVVGRMKPGVSVEAARQEISSAAAQISREFTEYGTAGRQFTTVGLQADGVREIRPALLALFGGVGLLLIVACANVTSLLIARSASRARETGVRMTLGAGTWRLARQCLAEGIVLSVLGAAAGLLVGWVGLKALLAIRPSSLARLGRAEIDTRVLLFTCGVACFWGLLCSLAPLRETLRAKLANAFQRDVHRVVGTLSVRTRVGLVVVQVALGVVLLVCAGLLVRTFVAMQRIDPGFQSDGMITFRMAVPFNRYRPPAASNALVRQLRESLAGLPGVTGVGAISHLPYDDLPNWGGQYLVRAGEDASTAPSADYRVVTPGFFEEVGATLVEGRFLSNEDTSGAQFSVVVDDLLARRAWPGQSALAHTLLVDPGSSGRPTINATVVGVVRHLRVRSLVEDLTEQVYYSSEQVTRNPLAYVVRTSGDPAALVPSIRSALAGLDSQIPIYDVRPFSEYVRAAMSGRRFTMTLAACFAAVAILLACVGVYGVMAYTVARRRGEFGVRLALGAMPSQLVGSVLREGLVLAAVGLSVGAAASLGLAQLLRSQLFGVSPSDPITYTVVLAALAGVLTLACWLPARATSTANPLDALRTE